MQNVVATRAEPPSRLNRPALPPPGAQQRAARPQPRAKHEVPIDVEERAMMVPNLNLPTEHAANTHRANRFSKSGVSRMKPDSKTEPTFEIRRIPVIAILADPSIQQREGGTSAHVVEEYAEAMRGGDDFPPIIVFSNDGVHYHLGDGFHRLGATLLVQREEIECEIHAGNWEDALLYACGANADHGLRRTCSDQRKAVLSLLGHAKWSLCSDREIARLCRVSHTLVGKVRRQRHLETKFTDASQQQPVNTVAPDRRRAVQRGGKRYEMNTAGIGKTTSRGKKAGRSPTLDPRAWSLSTPQAREGFVREVGAREIEAVISAVEPNALRRFESIEQACDSP
jgi:hypothetical protein